MKTLLVSGFLVLAATSGNASAACGGTGNPPLNQTALSTLLSGKTVCATLGGDKWQEEHMGTGGGALWDYKLGPGHAVDPREQVGTWSITGTGNSAQVNHIYGSGGSGGTFSYQVYNNGNSTYDFCTTGGGTTVPNASVIVSGPC